MVELYEAFVYLWYDALNNMFYLGKHKGSIDDNYTHSSTVWESFTKDNIPEGATREILAYGTHEEMCILEHELLVKAKNSGDWDRYYNQSLGDPRYVDTSGENHPMYGKASDWSKKLWQDPEHQKKMSERSKKRWQDPEYQKMQSERMTLQNKKQWQDPEYQKKMSERSKKQWQDPEFQKMQSERWQDPENKKKMSEKAKKQWEDSEFQKKMSEINKGKNNPMSRENRIKRAAEKQANSSTLDEFLA